MRRSATFLIILVAATLTSALPSAPQKRSGAPEKKAPAAQAKKEQEDERRALALGQVRDFAGRISSFKDTWTRSLTTARLATLLWKHDQPFARQLFTRALELSADDAAKGDKNRLTARDVAELRSKIIAQVERCDAAWAAQLAEEEDKRRNAEGAASTAKGAAPAIDGGQAALEGAYELIDEDHAKAAEIAGRSLQRGVSPFIVGLLKQLRQKDEKGANALFVRTLEQLATEPAPDGDTFLSLGTYVFTSPRVNPNDPMAFATVGVGRVLVPDISADRPGVPPEVVRAYLTAAARILARQFTDAKQKQLYYVAGRLLMPKAQKFAPELVSVIASQTQALAADVPQTLTNPASYEQFSNYTPKGFEESLREAEKTSDAAARDLRYLVLVYDRWQSRDFEAARAVAAKVSDGEARTRLETVIDFGQGVQALEKRDVATAEATARRLPKGIEQALLWLSIGGSASGDVQRVNESVTRALAAAAEVNDARRPYLILAAAALLTRVDPLRARATLSEAVQEFNKQEARELARVDWRRRVEVERLKRDFPLTSKGVNLKLDGALQPFLSGGDTSGVVTTVSQLTDERLLGQSLLTLASAMLK